MATADASGAGHPIDPDRARPVALRPIVPQEAVVARGPAPIPGSGAAGARAGPGAAHAFAAGPMALARRPHTGARPRAVPPAVSRGTAVAPGPNPGPRLMVAEAGEGDRGAGPRRYSALPHRDHQPLPITDQPSAFEVRRVHRDDGGARERPRADGGRAGQVAE